ncbi:MAG: cytochrome c [Chloroflexi bacterium]|nr:cytochrome c [Chloroflexota bacterium]
MILLKKMFRAHFVTLALALSLLVVLLSCSNMRAQPSFRPQQGPRPSTSEGIVATNDPTGPVRPVTVQQAAIGAASGDATMAGEDVYKTYCAMCHGVDGRGTGPVGQAFNPPPADLTAAVLDQRSDVLLFTFVSSGFGRMPPFQSDLTEEQRWAVIGYIRTLRK